MRLGFGSTVWFNSLNNKKLDGIGVYTQELWKAFEKEEEIKLLPLIFNREKSNHLIDFSKNITKAPLKFSIHIGLHTLLKIPFNELNAYQKDIDLFFAPDHHIPLMKTVPVVATVMDTIPFIHPEWIPSRFRKLKNFLFKKTILSADHIITISNYSKQDLINHLGISPDKISVVNLGVNEKFFQRIPEDKNKSILKKYTLKKDFFLFVGTLQPRKNIIRIIKAHRALPKEIKKKHPLVIVGQYGWNSQNLMDEIDIMSQNKDGMWLTYIEQEELYTLLQTALSLVYPSLYEGFGLPVIEAFASKCPVITSNITSLPEVAGNAALQVDPTSIEEIRHAMYRMTQDEALRETLKYAGSQRVKLYHWDKVAQEHLKIFKSLLA